MLGDEGVTRALTISWLSALGWVTGCGSPHGSEAVSDTERETSEPTSTTSSQSADETAATETSGTGHDGLLVEATVTRVVLDAGQDELIQLVAHDADDQSHPVPEGVVWSSSDPSVASVDDAGLVVAVATGDATVTASVAEQEVEVEVRVRGFTSAPVLLSDNLNIYADPGIAVVADGHGIIVNRDRDGVEHRVKLHVIEGSMGWQPNAVVAPAMTPVSSQAVPMSDHYLVAIRESNEAPAYFGYQPGGDLVPRPLAADTIYSQLTPSAWTDEAFVFHSDTYDGPLKALSVRVDDLTDFGTIDSGALQGAAFDSTGRGLVVTREADSDDLRILTYEPGSGFGTPTVISSADLEYATLCTKIAINEAGDGAILQIRDLSPVGARIIPIEAGKVGAPHPPFSEPEGLWCASELVVTRSGRLYIGRDDVDTGYDDVTIVEYLGGGETEPLEYYAMAPGRLVSNGSSPWMIGYESGVGASGDFAARRFDEDYGWQDPVVLPEFAPDGEVLSFSTAPDGSMLGMVQHGPYGSYFAYGIVYR